MGARLMLALYLFISENLELKCLPREYKHDGICCPMCERGAGLIVKERCTTTSNTVCECQVGRFCLNQECDLCQEHTQCKPGQYVKKPGTGRTDTVCENCPPGHFSNETNSNVCFPWSKCSEFGFVEFKEGNSITDALCKAERGHLWAFLALLSPGFVAIIVFLNGLYKPVKIQKEDEYSFSEEEQGIREAGIERHLKGT
ncbi:tumor necrosis factor receptor superfamily member 5-like isoform X2 [Eleutherodactylus coqui]|uniref:tumor necrosis factor receptor superfamily member 5-like isoform X2 n=1 Tax=Eleutherodactylus coqui TaxID=57060 RepID=UPI003462B435